MDTRFPRANKLNKIFKSNTVKVSYSCTQIISQIIKRHNKKVTQIQWHYQLEFNCPIKSECPLNSDCLKEDVIYRCTSLTTLYPKRVYLGIADIKMQRYYNSTQWSQNENYSNSATLQLCLENKENEKGNTKISLGNIQTAAPYTNTTTRCSLYLYEKLAILMYPNQSELLSKRSKLVSKCPHENKFILQTFKSNEWRKCLYSLMWCPWIN